MSNDLNAGYGCPAESACESLDWRAQEDASAPPAVTRSSCVPDSTIRPASITWITSARMAVVKRCVMMMVLRPVVAACSRSTL